MRYFQLKKHMGLQNQFSDVSSESILIVFVVLVGKSVRYLHSVLFAILHVFGVLHPEHPNFEDTLYGVVGSRLAGIILMCEQLNLESKNWSDNEAVDCVVCLNRLGEGDLVRELACRHVFHKDCFDGWLLQRNFTCPLCRAQLVADEFVEATHQKVARDLLDWFQSH